MDKAYLQDVAEFTIAKWWNKFFRVYPIIKETPPAVKLNNRLKTTAGRAHLDYRFIDLSPELFWQYTENFVHDTIPHELAHIVAYIVYGDEGHGQGWKSIIREFNIATTRCHDMVNQIHEKRKSK